MADDQSTVDGVYTALSLRIERVPTERAEQIADREARMIRGNAEPDDKWRSNV